MSKYIFMLCHHRAEMVDICLDNARRFTSNGLANFILLDQHYPLPSEQEQHEALRTVVDKYGVTLMDAGKGLGWRGGFNYLADKVSLRDGDVFIGYDPDARAITKDYDLALEAVALDPRVAWCSLISSIPEEEMANRGWAPAEIAGHRCKVPMRPGVSGISAMSGKWFREMGGVHDGGGDYGHFETVTFELAMRSRRLQVYLRDVWEGYWNPADWVVDAEYMEWKHLYGQKGLKLSFNEFLAWKGKV